MASRILSNAILVNLEIQSGDGVPSHLNKVGYLYVDRNNGDYYVGKGGVTWDLLSSGGGTGDTFVTAFTYNDANKFIITRNDAVSLDASFNSVTGLTVNGNLTVTGTTSGSTFNITTTPTNNNSLTEILGRNSTTGEIEYRNVSTIGGGSSGDTFVSGGTYNNTTNNINFSGNSVETTFDVDLTPLVSYLSANTYVISGNYINSTDTISLLRNDGNFVNITGITDTFVTAFTYNNLNKLTLSRNEGQSDLDVNINIMSGLTINGGLTATTGLFSSSTDSVLTIIGSGGTNTGPLFSVMGSTGELFSVSDISEGSLFSVNDISGLPILDAGTILLNNYLYVSAYSEFNGDVSITGNTTIDGNLIVSGTTSASTFNITTTPTNNNSLTEILGRNSSTGEIEYRDVSTIGGGSSGDTFVTGGTYSSNTLTLDRNDGNSVVVTGFTSGGSGVSSVTAGAGLSGDTTTGDITLINTAPDQTVTISGGTDIGVTGVYPNFSISYTGSPSGGLSTKAGTVAGSSFSGNPKKYTLTFGSSFADANYSISISSEINRNFTYESKTASGFVINANANASFTEDVDWICIKHGET